MKKEFGRQQKPAVDSGGNYDDRARCNLRCDQIYNEKEIKLVFTNIRF